MVSHSDNEDLLVQHQYSILRKKTPYSKSNSQFRSCLLLKLGVMFSSGVASRMGSPGERNTVAVGLSLALGEELSPKVAPSAQKIGSS